MISPRRFSISTDASSPLLASSGKSVYSDDVTQYIPAKRSRCSEERVRDVLTYVGIVFMFSALVILCVALSLALKHQLDGRRLPQEDNYGRKFLLIDG